MNLDVADLCQSTAAEAWEQRHLVVGARLALNMCGHTLAFIRVCFVAVVVLAHSSITFTRALLNTDVTMISTN